MSDTLSGDANAVSTEAVVEQLLSGLEQAARDITPEFIRTMPRAYFDDTTEAMRLSHIKAIIAAEASGMAQTVTLRDADAHHFTFISNHSYPGQLSEFVQRLPHELPLTSAKVYTSEQGNRVLDIFHFGEHLPYDPTDPDQSARAAELQVFFSDQRDGSDVIAIEHHLASCDAGYLLGTPTEQIYRHFLLVEQARRDGNQKVQLERYHDTGLDRLSIVLTQQDPRLLFERISSYLGQQAIDIHRAYLDSFQDGDDGVTLLTFIIDTPRDPSKAPVDSWERMAFDLHRLGHLDADALELAGSVTKGDLLAAEILITLSRLAHQNLVKRDPLLFTRERIIAMLQRYPQLAMAVSNCFLQRFEAASIGGESEALRTTLTRDTESEDAGIVFNTLLDAVHATLRTNLLLPERRALALRLDPRFFAIGAEDEVPFGVFYAHGLQFDGFHVRFRDIARGGVRIVRPRGQEQYALETERHFEEAYGLAHAQQHKNKDIPEGGSKGVVLAAPEADFDRVGRAFADALLDLIIPDGPLHHLHKDYYNKDELLYLGPDENISNQLITWIVERARQRGHPMPDAFMSSKPATGINHKQYGVTSEGVTVFLEHALRAAGIDPRQQPFTIKMTGGPDGDVAGNEILILEREFKDKARILGMADGSGIAEDPDGLDMQELVRLVRSELPIADFDRAKLGPHGRVLGIDEPGGVNLRNTLHNRIVADAFIPAGGRPNTINSANWESFLDADGNPSARVIVEGANLFITQEARSRLSQKGVIIIKDSSANKCGVICSSYEIVASMLLEPQTFVAIKSRFVAEVLERLRILAGLEARTLFKEHLHKPSAHLPDLSVRLSRAINRATDAIADSVTAMQSAHPQLLQQLVIDHLPPTLYQHSGEQALERIPTTYLDRIIASNLASRIVYREGLDWLESMGPEAIARLAERYLVEDAQVQELIRQVQESELADRERIAHLLQGGGVSASLRSRDN